MNFFMFFSFQPRFLEGVLCRHCLQVPAVSGRPGHSVVSRVARGAVKREMVPSVAVEAARPSKELQQLVETLQMLPEMDKRSGAVVGFWLGIWGVSCDFLWFLVGGLSFSPCVESNLGDFCCGRCKGSLGGFET